MKLTFLVSIYAEIGCSKVVRTTRTKFAENARGMRERESQREREKSVCVCGPKNLGNQKLKFPLAPKILGK